MRTKIFVEDKLLLDIKDCVEAFKLYDVMYFNKEKHMIETVSIDFISGDPINSVYLRNVDEWEKEFIK